MVINTLTCVGRDETESFVFNILLKEKETNLIKSVNDELFSFV